LDIGIKETRIHLNCVLGNGNTKTDLLDTDCGNVNSNKMT